MKDTYLIDNIYSTGPFNSVRSIWKVTFTTEKILNTRCENTEFHWLQAGTINKIIKSDSKLYPNDSNLKYWKQEKCNYSGKLRYWISNDF